MAKKKSRKPIPKSARRSEATNKDVAMVEPLQDDPFDNDEDMFQRELTSITVSDGGAMPMSDSDDDEAVLGLSSDDEDDELIAKLEEELRQHQAITLPSESEEEDVPKSIKKVKVGTLGRKRSEAHGADIGPLGKRKLKEDLPESVLDPTVAEEEEALRIQKKLAQDLELDDFDINFMQAATKDGKGNVEEEDNHITTDLSSLSKKEKMKLLQDEAPELLDLITDLKAKLLIIEQKLLPLHLLVSKGSLPPSSAADYISCKTHLYLSYCVNVGYYLMLKSKRIPVHNHAVIDHLVNYRMLLKKMEEFDETAEPVVNDVLMRIEAGEDVIFSVGKIPSVLDCIAQEQAKRKVMRKFKNKSESDEMSNESDADDELSKQTERDPFGGRRKRMKYEDEQNDAEDENRKRAINFEIFKNKGLTPYRNKKEQNPRVKNKRKYKKALVRRKGAVRTVRKELTPYGGELTGIRSGIVRSTKFKYK